MNPHFFNDIVSILQSFLADKALITSDLSTSVITIKPVIPSGVHVGVFLTNLKNPFWENIIIPLNIKVVLEGWLIDVDDVDEYGDIWCLNWMTERYNVVNNCEKWRNRYES